MNIKNKSLYGVNIVFLLNESAPAPENSEFTSLFSGDIAEGMNFFDNAGIRAKILDVPKLSLSVIFEGRRLRIEDRSQKEFSESVLIENAVKVYNHLFGDKPGALAGYGFNFDLVYQLKDVVRIHELFGQISPTGIAMGDGLMDLGWQWTISNKNGKKLEGYFVKVSAPMELSVHHNAHYNERILPKAEELKKQMEEDYEKVHMVIESLML